jgi:hypothetical protein
MVSEEHDDRGREGPEDAGAAAADGPPGAWPVALTAEVFARAVWPLRPPDADPARVAADAVAAAELAAELSRQFGPRDAAEELLVAQLVWTHARITALTRVAGLQKNVRWFSLYSAELTRANHLFRRQLQALDDHRRPARRSSGGTSFTTIRTTAQVAHQLFATPAAPDGGPDGLALPDEASAEATVPAHGRRLRRPPPKRLGPPPLDEEHGPADPAGEDDQ